MTIAAGFKTNEGIVICADTQETVDRYSKRLVPKLKFCEAGPRFYNDGSQIERGSVAFCGSTDNGPFVDMLIQRALDASLDGGTLPETCARIEREIKAVYTEYGNSYQAGYCPSAEVIYGVTQNSESRLFAADGPVVNEVEKFAARGIGSHLAYFIAERRMGLSLTLYQCFMLASYMLSEVKEHVEGCGGESHVAVLSNRSQSGVVDRVRVQTAETLVQEVERSASELIVKLSDPQIETGDWLDAREALEGVSRSARGEAREKIQRYEEQCLMLQEHLVGRPLERDRFGFHKFSHRADESLDNRAAAP